MPIIAQYRGATADICYWSNRRAVWVKEETWRRITAEVWYPYGIRWSCASSTHLWQRPIVHAVCKWTTIQASHSVICVYFISGQRDRLILAAAAARIRSVESIHSIRCMLILSRQWQSHGNVRWGFCSFVALFQVLCTSIYADGCHSCTSYYIS